MRTTTSKVPTVANWSRDTTIRLASKLFMLAKNKPEEFEVLMTLLAGKFLRDSQHSKETISKLWDEKIEQLDQITKLEEKVEELEEKLGSREP